MNVVARLVPAAALAALLAACSGGDHPVLINPDGGACAGEESRPIAGETHETEGTPIAYADNPPSSGNHWPCWAPWGVARSVLPTERWVHNLEHGGVVLLYKCDTVDGCPQLSQPLVDIAGRLPDAPGGGHRVLVTADPDLPQNIAAVAWGFRMLADAPVEADLACFAASHEGHGPEDISSDPPTDACPQSYQ